MRFLFQFLVQKPVRIMSTAAPSSSRFPKILLLSLTALGVVYGDIGTSPLYAINELFFGHAAVHRTRADIIGAISLVIWALTIIVAFKYVFFVLRADYDGEGGVFALYAMLRHKKTKFTLLLVGLLIFAAGLLYGDGIITPAISVISAVEGLQMITTSLQHWVVPITIVILIGLFSIQRQGTSKVGSIFGPVITVWFFVIALLGLAQIIPHPAILEAINPLNALQFLFSNSIRENMFILGSVMLAVTGGEAMYADMGHFGRKPIRLSWFILVFPALLLNYLGQGAFLLSSHAVMNGNIFYSMVPNVMLIPMVILATFATVIASQALISGAYSLTMQAVGLGLLPRIKIKQTHAHHQGQIYVGFVNWVLLIGCIALVLVFQSSNRLASAYGLAVSGVMLVTSLSMIAIAIYYWKWSKTKTLLLFVPLALIDATFLFSNSLKLLDGGFIPLCIAIGIYLVMTIWLWGRANVSKTYTMHASLTVKDLIDLKQKQTVFLPRSSVFMSPLPIETLEDKIPPLVEIFHNRYEYLPKHIILLTVRAKKHPYIHDDEGRYEVIKFYDDPDKGSITGVKVRFGFMEEHNVEEILEGLAQHHELNLEANHKDWLVHVIQEKIVTDPHIKLLRRLRFNIYKFLQRNSDTADHYFGLGNEVGLTIESVPVSYK